MLFQIGPAVTMFIITVLFTAALLYPAFKFTHRSKLIGFYWIGFWGFLGWISALSGAKSIVGVLGYDVERFATAVLTGITASFVVFVMFAWARLTLRGVTNVAKKVNVKS